MTRTHNASADRYEYKISRHGTRGAIAAPVAGGLLVTVGDFTASGFVADPDQFRTERYRVATSLDHATIMVSKVRNRWLAA